MNNLNYVAGMSESVEYFCPICENTEAFVEHRGIPGQKCVKCKSLVRTRLNMIVLKSLGYFQNSFFQENLKVAHFAPEKALYDRLSLAKKKIFRPTRENKNYSCYDFVPSTYSFAKKIIKQCDMCNVDECFGNQQFDVIIHNHVLEHLPCDAGESLARLNTYLKPGGAHLFSIPMRTIKGADDTPYLEDLDPDLSPLERKKRFAQEDHMRIFNAKTVVLWLESVLSQKGLVFPLHELVSERAAERYGLLNVYKDCQAGRVSGHTVFLYRSHT